MTKALDTFTSGVGSPDGAIGFRAYVHISIHMAMDSASAVHLKAFAKVLRLAHDIDPTSFDKAFRQGVTQTVAVEHTAFVQKLRQAI